MSSIAWNVAIQQLRTDKIMNTIISDNEKTNICVLTHK